MYICTHLHIRLGCRSSRIYTYLKIGLACRSRDVPLRNLPDSMTALRDWTSGWGLFVSASKCSQPSTDRSTHPCFAGSTSATNCQRHVALHQEMSTLALHVNPSPGRTFNLLFFVAPSPLENPAPRTSLFYSSGARSTVLKQKSARPPPPPRAPRRQTLNPVP